MSCAGRQLGRGECGVPVGAEDVRAEMADQGVFILGADDVQHAEALTRRRPAGPESTRCSRCLPRLTTSSVVAPVKSRAEIPGQRRSLRVSGSPANA
ncbi:hypothetical protein [Micropruina sp.]|uniref:hypothetical protein n=1 Tax=Micropruina sp. TaxID=2737536 RepID=UPI0039E2DB9D